MVGNIKEGTYRDTERGKRGNKDGKEHGGAGEKGGMLRVATN